MDYSPYPDSHSVDLHAFHLLRLARKLIDDPIRWTQRQFHMRLCPGHNAFCMVGALRAYSSLRSPAYKRAMHHLIEAVPAVDPRPFEQPPTNHKKVTRFNDRPTTTHDQVLAAYDRAIAYAEAACSRPDALLAA